MPITPQQALQRTIEHREIFHDEMVDLMRQIMRGEVSPAMVAAILTGLRVKKETIGEIAAAASVMREMVARVPYSGALSAAGADAHLVDIVGTGGDGANTFNISTASMFVVAAAGARVAKHGNRSVSSKFRQRRRARSARRRDRPAAGAGRAVDRARPASASCSRRTIIRR